MGVWVWVPCPFLCVYMWGEGVNIRLRAWGWEHMLVYMCACRLRLCVRSGLRLRLTHHLSRPPPHHHALPVEDAAGALVISRAGAGCSGERRPTLGGRLAGPGPTGLAGPRLWGGGPLGLRAQGPVRPGVVDCRWSLRACRHGTLGRLHCGCRRSRLRALLCPFLGVPAVVLLGVPCPGGLWMFGARVFSVPASCLAGWGCCSPHTLLNIYMEEPYEHKRAHTHKCTLKHSHWYKNRCSQTHIVLICCCFKTYFVILVMCAAQ